MSRPTAIKTLFLLCSLFVPALCSAQVARTSLPSPVSASGNATKSSLHMTGLSGVVDRSTVTTHWGNKLVRLSARNHGLPEVNAVKDAKLAEKLASARKGSTSALGSAKAVTPVIGTNFEANWSTQQTPPDNSLAVSNGGWIVSTNNDGIVYAQTNGSITYGAFWPDFFQGQGLFSNIYDPKVLYDSQSDRFFMVVLHGSEASSSIMLLCFSQTNNPSDGWYIYQLVGNVLSNNCWFDYPAIGVSNNEVYLTGNLFTSGNNQFNQAILFQIEKSTGYSGGNLNWTYWYNLTADITPFSLVPASWGQSGNYGPGILLVSGAAGGDNKYIVWDLTNDLGANPSLNAYTVTTVPYSPAADAQMPNNGDLLDNGDCRMLGAFYLNNTLHCIHHGDVSNGWNGLLYNRIDITNLNCVRSSLGDPGTIDMSFPQLTSFGTNVNDPSVMVAFLQSSTQVYPEVRVVNCDAGMNWSNATLVKSGETYVDFLPGEDRWGDYTGMARKQNASPPEAWIGGCYGANVQGILDHTWKTWIAEVNGGAVSVDDAQADALATNLYPVPAMDFFTLDIEVKERAQHSIKLFDAQGSLVKLLYEGTPAVGPNRLYFNRGELSPGTYTLIVSNPTTRIAHETLVVQ